MKKYLHLYRWNLVTAALLLLGAYMGVLPADVAAGATMAGVALTSSAQLGNGTLVYISRGSPTSYLLIGNVRDVKFLDGSSAEIDVTNLSSTWKEKKLGLPDGGTVTFKCDTDFGDVGQAALLAAKNAREKCDLKIVLPGGTTPTAEMEGYVRKFNAGTSVDNPVSSDVEFLVTGPVTLS